MTPPAGIDIRRGPEADPCVTGADRAERPSPRFRHYAIGPAGVSVGCDLTCAAEAFHRHYAAYELPAPRPGMFRMEVAAERSPRTLRLYYHISGNGEELFVVRRPLSVLPHLEWAINIMAAKYLPGYLQIHASVMARDGLAVIFPGDPGHGKTTLAAGLLARGWDYLSDEFALIDPHSGLLHAYPKVLCVKAGSFEVLERMGLPLSAWPAYLKGDKGPVRFVNPLDVRADAVPGPCRVGAVVFPRYGEGPPSAKPISRAQAVFELTRVSFNFTKFRTRGFHLLADLVEQAKCYRLAAGELTATCRMVESLAVVHECAGK